MSAGRCSPDATARWTALLRPANEKCGSGEPSNGRGSGTAVGSPVAASASSAGPAGIIEAEQLGRLVERLADRIVDGRRQALVAADAGHFEQLAMAARDQQQQIGEAEVRIDQPRRQRVAFEMVDRDQRLAGGERQALAGEQRDHDATDQPGAGGGGDRVDLRDVDAGFVDHPADQAGQDLDMGAGGDFRDDAAIGLVGGVLADDRVGEDPPVAADDRGGAVVARGFEAEDQAWSRPLPQPAPMH